MRQFAEPSDADAGHCLPSHGHHRLASVRLLHRKHALAALLAEPLEKLMRQNGLAIAKTNFDRSPLRPYVPKSDKQRSHRVAGCALFVRDPAHAGPRRRMGFRRVPSSDLRPSTAVDSTETDLAFRRFFGGDVFVGGDSEAGAAFRTLPRPALETSRPVQTMPVRTEELDLTFF